MQTRGMTIKLDTTIYRVVLLFFLNDTACMWTRLRGLLLVYLSHC